MVKNINYFYYLLMFCLMSFLGGCTTTFENNEQVQGPNLTQNEWNNQRNILLEKESFISRGSIDLDLVPNGPYGNTTNTTGHANYTYQVKPNMYMFAITHFAAGLILQIKSGGSVKGIELTNSDGTKYHFSSEQELNNIVHVPVSRVPYWIMGLELGDEDSVIKDENGRIEKITKSGWTIKYYEYAKFDELILPKRVEMKNLSVGTLKLVVEKWEF